MAGLVLFGCKSPAAGPAPVPVADPAAIPDNAFIAIRRDRRTKRVSRAAVANLLAEFQRAGYFSWKDSYETEATDMPTVTTWVTVGTRMKKITDYGPTPLLPSERDRFVREKLAALEDRVDAVRPDSSSRS